jgi:hypothetical protein
VSEKIIYLGQFGEKVEADDKYIKEAEMFSTGIHRGVEYTEEDLNGLIENFSAEDDIPVQLDHSESARDTVGYIREAFAKGGKLMGKLEILDEAIQKRIDKGLMKKLSVSFYLKHTEEGFKPHKLREVSLVAFPQVKGARLFSENGYVSDYEEKGGNEEMAIDKVKFGEEELTIEQLFEKAKSEAYKQAESEVHEKYSELEAKLEKLEGVEQKFNENQVSQKVAKFQEENKVVPAQAEALEKLMASFSEEQAGLFEEFMKNNKSVDFSEQGEVEQDEHEDDKEGDNGQDEFDKFYEQHVNKYGASL